MSEDEWLACTDPQKMVDFLRGKATGRKLRLFAVACCRRVSQLLADDRNRRAIEVVERYADGLAPKKTLKAARRKTSQVYHEKPRLIGHDYDWARAYAEGATHCLTLGPYESANATASCAAKAVSQACSPDEGAEQATRAEAAHTTERLVQAQLLLEIFGCLPFRALSVSASCLTWKAGTVVKLADTIYEKRAFDRLPVLADALEEAGCDNADVLDHCRQPGEHVRGCWVVDLLTGRE